MGITPAAVESILDLVPRLPCHDVVNNSIGLIVEGKKLMLRGRGVNDSKWTDVDVEGVTVKGKRVTAYLNRDFLTKALKFGMSTIEFIDALTPMKFSNAGKQMIVMPVRSSDPVQSAPHPATSAATTPDTATNTPEGPQESLTPRSSLNVKVHMNSLSFASLRDENRKADLLLVISSLWSCSLY
jgi:hypothetical protein